MYKLIALDMDGTLLNSDKQVSPRTKQAIADARAQGVKVVLASGRPLEGMTAYLTELDILSDDDFVLSYNASLIQRVASRQIIHRQVIQGSDAKNVASLAADLGVHVHAFSPERGLITPQNSRYTEHESILNSMPVTELDFAELDDQEEIIKVMMVADPDILSAAISKLPAMLYEQYSVVQSAPFFLEVLHPQSNKGAGVAMLAEHLKISADEVICMGDAGNDHHMIRYAGLGVAMGNACDATKALADHITDTNDNDGVAQVIESFVLKP
ncbi:sugar-phosphatase [Photobacterium sp. TY1-4]|uniref:sugar-phosphatase n=1 Tax=Photobacterium sp. TY1-4 TaxID=2899122 RepID=UPI0021BFA6FB|nr:sugar-phosphatase [Photobacterium sp. TY1-4]UXI03727.1 sugar-phosphatase [Photobacterium sp. TY1-4]